MEMKDYLARKYQPNKPIFLSDVCLPGASRAYVRQRLAQYEKAGILCRYSNGIYYFPLMTSFGLAKPSFDEVIKLKYIASGKDVYGYYTGIAFRNKIGMSQQVPAIPEIVTNKESTRRRMVVIGSRTVILKKPLLRVTSQNAALQQFLDLFRNMSEKEVISHRKRFADYIQKQQFSRSLLQKVLPRYPKKVISVLLESGLIYEFALE